MGEVHPTRVISLGDEKKDAAVDGSNQMTYVRTLSSAHRPFLHPILTVSIGGPPHFSQFFLLCQSLSELAYSPHHTHPHHLFRQRRQKDKTTRRMSSRFENRNSGERAQLSDIENNKEQSRTERPAVLDCCYKTMT